MATDYSSVSSTQFVDLPEGRIAYDVTGEGPLLLLVPGMGDLRSAYRHLAPLLVEAGCRVATTDLRGHGDSDATFDSYGSVETAGDILAVIEQLGAPAVVVGNSMSAGSAAYAAAERPDLVCGLVLLGPFVRDGDLGAFTKAMLRVATAPPWAATMWKAYAPTLYAGRKPEDLDAHLSQLKASMKRPGYATSFSRTARVSHAPVEARLGEVSAPTLVVMGEKDPDFPDPRVEAEWIGSALDGTVTMVPEAGHYPQSQQPDLVSSAIVGFLGSSGLHG